MLVASVVLTVLLLKNREVEVADATFLIVKILPSAVYSTAVFVLVFEYIRVIRLDIFKLIGRIYVKNEERVGV